MLYLRFFVFNLAESTQVKWYYNVFVSILFSLQKRKVKVKFANRQGRQPKKRIIRSFRVYSILLFYDLKFHGSFKSMLCLWFATVLTTSFNGLFSNFAERRESVMKCSLLHSRFQCHHAMLLPYNMIRSQVLVFETPGTLTLLLDYSVYFRPSLNPACLSP